MSEELKTQILLFGYITKPQKYQYYPTKDGSGYIWVCPNCKAEIKTKNRQTARTMVSKAGRRGNCYKCRT